MNAMPDKASRLRGLGRKVLALTGGEFGRFVFVRALCAVVTYGAYLLLLVPVSYEAAYVLSYLLGIALAYVTSAKFVFRREVSRRSALLFPLVYIVQFAFGFVVIRFAVDYLGVPEGLGLAVSVLATLPVTFAMSRWIIHRG